MVQETPLNGRYFLDLALAGAGIGHTSARRFFGVASAGLGFSGHQHRRES